MAVDPFSLLALFGFTIIVGYIGALIFAKTGISDIIWLLLLGILIGPVFNLVDRSLFLFISPFLAAVALLVILFDAGLNMDLYRMIHNVPRSFLLAILGVVFAMLAVGLMAGPLLGVGFATGMLIGAILGGTSSPIVLSMAAKAKVRDHVKTLVSLESIFTDPLVIVVSLAMINIIAQNANFSALGSVMSAFSVGAVIGVISGIVWLFVLQKLRGKKFDYMLTLAVLFLIYVFVESSAGSGAIASLFFGLVLGNGFAISKMLKIAKKEGADPLLRTFQSEVSFFIRSFFFVFLGLITAINPTLALYGIVIAIALVAVRVAAVEISLLRMAVTSVERNTMRVMAPRGLAAAVLAQFPAAFGIPGAQIISDIVFIVIIVTVLYTTVAMKFVDSRSTRRPKPQGTDAATKKVMKGEMKELKAEEKEISRELGTGAKRRKRRGKRRRGAG